MAVTYSNCVRTQKPGERGGDINVLFSGNSRNPRFALDVRPPVPDHPPPSGQVLPATAAVHDLGLCFYNSLAGPCEVLKNPRAISSIADGLCHRFRKSPKLR